jgi:hypothetical protein
MRKFVISATAVTVFAALMASAPANAVDNFGPTKVENQCFKASTNVGRDLSFGTWGACPQPANVASAPVATRHKKRHR